MKTLDEVLESYRDHPQFLGLALNDPNQRGALDDAPLHIAASRGEVGDVKVLLAHGADVNIVGDMGYTPLHCAAMNGRTGVIKALLEAGANPSPVNEFGTTPLQTAELGNHRAAAELLRDL